jgi:hypothetical protein
VAINTGGVAIVAIRPGHLLYTRSFGWDSRVGSSGSQARLLQRYSLVAFLAPELRRAMAAANAVGSPVRAVVTCGNLPDLRSLTMPLIEELDIEVETLDSLDGLIVKPAAMERLTETAAAIRLACAGAVARATRPWDDAKRVAAERSRALISAAALFLVLAGCAAAYVVFDRWLRPGPPHRAPVTRTAQAPQPAPARPLPRPTPPAVTGPAAPKPNPPAVSAPAEPSKSNPPPTAQPVPSTASAGTRYAVGPGTGEPKPRRPALLRDPVPRVTAILVSDERRLATVDDGHIVGVGDVLGRRVVIRIDDRAVILREPSGVEIRVGLGGRVLGGGRPAAGGTGM